MKKVLGMGNALTDMLLQIESDDVIEQMNLLRGGMHLIDFEKTQAIRTQFDLSKAKKAAGGSASNTIKGITRLGGQAGFIGKVGRDEVGKFFYDDSVAHGIEPQLIYSEHNSGVCTVLVSKDGERTMCTFLGAASDLEAGDISPEMFADYDIFHVEGYLVQNHALIHKVVKMAKEAGLLVSMDLASHNVVEENLEFLADLVDQYVDIVFANEDEARAFTGKDTLDALDEIAQKVDIAIVKIGKHGSYVKSHDEQYSIQPYPASCIDTTGAGDLYAAGFLYGLSINLPLNKCGELGSLVSSKVVEVFGAQMDNEIWEKINEEIQLIIE